MVLNYYPANYTGWPIPAFYYVAKIQKKSDISKYFCKYFSLKYYLFTRPSNTFSMAFRQVSGGLPTNSI